MFVFTNESINGFQRWPLTEKETVGYVVKNNINHHHCFIVERVDFTTMPHYKKYNLDPSMITIGTFHSHPVGCYGNTCYYQPPSLRDLKTFYKLATGSLSLKINFVVGAKKLFIVDMTKATGSREELSVFLKMLQEFKTLKNKNLDLSAHEMIWISISKKYTSIMTLFLQDY